MRVVGFLCAWGNANIISSTIENHLKICDELIVCVSAHHPAFFKFEDNTLEIVKAHNIKILQVDPPSGVMSCDHFKCRILNQMIEQTGVGKDDIIMISDVDEFYDDNFISELKNEFNTPGWDLLEVEDMFFVVNMDWYVRSTHYRFFRLADNPIFQPTQRMTPAPQNIKKVGRDNPMFHYSMLMDMDYKRTH